MRSTSPALPPPKFFITNMNLTIKKVPLVSTTDFAFISIPSAVRSFYFSLLYNQTIHHLLVKSRFEFLPTLIAILPQTAYGRFELLATTLLAL
jgi:hypothetical protein